jgi:hypothetical protein
MAVAAFPKQWDSLRLNRDEARSTVQLRSSITNRPDRFSGKPMKSTSRWRLDA